MGDGCRRRHPPTGDCAAQSRWRGTRPSLVAAWRRPTSRFILCLRRSSSVPELGDWVGRCPVGVRSAPRRRGRPDSERHGTVRRALLRCASRRRIRDTRAMRSRRHPPVRPAPSSAFAGYRFPPEVITLAVRWYLRFGLSYRDVEELLAERGIEVDHVTVYRWVAVRPRVRGGGSASTARHRGSLACR